MYAAPIRLMAAIGPLASITLRGSNIVIENQYPSLDSRIIKRNRKTIAAKPTPSRVAILETGKVFLKERTRPSQRQDNPRMPPRSERVVSRP